LDQLILINQTLSTQFCTCAIPWIATNSKLYEECDRSTGYTNPRMDTPASVQIARVHARPKVSKDFNWEVMRENATWNETANTHARTVSPLYTTPVRGSENVRSRCTIARCVRNIKSRFYGYCPTPRTFFFFLYLSLSPIPLRSGDATAGVRVSHGSGALSSRNY